MKDISYIENMTNDILTVYYVDGFSKEIITEQFDLVEVNIKKELSNDSEIEYLIEGSSSQLEFISKLKEERERLKSEFISKPNSNNYERIILYSSFIKLLEFNNSNTDRATFEENRNRTADMGSVLVHGVGNCSTDVEIGFLNESTMKGCVGGSVIEAIDRVYTDTTVGENRK
ncbi:MAG: hypothetical protein AAFO07_12520 [Bacteroidota bacterium]